MAEGTSSSDLLSYYTRLGKPLIAFGPDVRVVEPYAGSRVRTIPWPVKSDDLIHAVRAGLEEAGW